MLKHLSKRFIIKDIFLVFNLQESEEDVRAFKTNARSHHPAAVCKVFHGVTLC